MENKELKYRFIDEKTGIGKVTIICPISLYPPEKISLLGYGDNGICGISGNTGRCFTPIYSQAAN